MLHVLAMSEILLRLNKEANLGQTQTYVLRLTLLKQEPATSDPQFSFRSYQVLFQNVTIHGCIHMTVDLVQSARTVRTNTAPYH